MEVVVKADEGNSVRYRLEDGAEALRNSDVTLPRRYVASFPDDRGGPELMLAFEVRSGVPQCRELLLRCTDDGREIRQSDIASANVEELCEIASQLVALHVAESFEGGGAVVVHSHREPDLANVARSVSRARRNTRRQLPDDKLPEVAEVYRANPARPTRAVAERFGIAHRTATLYVRRARDAGHLGERD